jgi:vesicle-fusing ATPase
MSLSEPQRSWMQVSLMDVVHVQIYDPFVDGGHTYLGGLDLEVGFAGKKTTETPYDQDELASYFIRVR